MAAVEVATPVGPLLLEVAGATHLVLRLERGKRVTLFNVEHDVLTAHVHHVDGRWQVGTFERGEFKPWGGLSLYRPTGPHTSTTASEAATRKVRAIAAVAAQLFAERNPQALVAGEAERLEGVERAAQDMLAKLEQEAALVRRCADVALSGEPDQLEGYDTWRWLSEGGRAHQLGVDAYCRRGSYRIEVVPRGTPPLPRPEWEAIR